MSVKTTTVYNCDYCQKQLPDDYATTNGEGKGYYVKKAHDTIPLDTPIAGCTGIVVEVTLGTPKTTTTLQTFATTVALSSLKWL